MIKCESNYDPEKKLWSGRVKKQLFNPKLSVGEVIRHCLLRNPNKIAQISDDTNVYLTNEDIFRRSLKIGTFIRQKNLKIGDVVGVVARNSENLAPLVFGLFYCGVAVNTLDTSFNKDEIINLFKFTKPKLVFCDSDEYLTVKDALRTLSNNASIYTVSGKVEESGIFSVGDIIAHTSEKDADNFEPNEPEDGRTQPAMIICSSGTTGSHKGVCLSHTTLLSSSMKLEETDVFLCFSTLYWLSGILSLILGTIGGVTRIITTTPFSPELLLRLIEQYKVTVLLTPPSQLAMALRSPDIERKDLSSVKHYLCAGSFVSPTLCDKMDQYLSNSRVSAGFGLSETGGFTNANNKPYRYGSVGKVTNNVILKIINEEGQAVGPNLSGEICLKTPYRFLTYCGLEEEVSSIVDAEEWIHTGDLGYMDDDGFLFLIGRTKEIMKYKNYHFSPSDIEEHILQLLGIEQVCVCGVPDPICTDLPAVLIVRKPGSSITESDVHEHIRTNLSDSKQLRGGVYFVDQIPMTASGKYLRNKAKYIAVKYFKENKKKTFEYCEDEN